MQVSAMMRGAGLEGGASDTALGALPALGVPSAANGTGTTNSHFAIRDGATPRNWNGYQYGCWCWLRTLLSAGYIGGSLGGLVGGLGTTDTTVAPVDTIPSEGRFQVQFQVRPTRSCIVISAHLTSLSSPATTRHGIHWRSSKCVPFL